MADASAARTKAVFEFKSATLPLIAVILKTTDLGVLAEAALETKDGAGDVERFKGAPFHAPLKRLDETRAARSPVLRWTAPEGSNQAA